MRKLHVLSLVTLLGFSFVGCRRDIRYEPPPPITGDVITDLKDGWVELYSETGFRGNTLTIKNPKMEPDFGAILSDDGKADFGGKGKSVKWQLPVGWQAILFSKPSFKGESFPLLGTGKVEANPDLGKFAGEPHSLRWERKP